ncbi:DUF2463 domain-containing protein [Encephalitozoon intestinalis]|nr:DUF2463 domain-containing protein [Encephalitozoon intestinalis]
MAFISIPEQTTIQHSDHQGSSKLNFHRLLDLYFTFATPISILIPLLMGITLAKNTFKSNSLLRFIFLAIPLSHLSLLNLRSFFAIKNSNEKSPSHSILHSVFRFLFFTFSIISILLVPMFYLENPEDIKSFLSSSCLFPYQLLIYSPPPAPLLPFPLSILVSTPSSIYSFYYPL